MELKSLIHDKDAEQEGSWVTFKDTDFKLKLRYAETKKMSKLIKKARTSGNGKELPPELLEDSMKKFIAEKAIADWSGLTSEGEEVPFSFDMAMKVLDDPDLVLFCIKEMGNAENFKAERVEELEAETKSDPDLAT